MADKEAGVPGARWSWLTPHRRRFFAVALLAAICVLPIVLYLPFLKEPFSNDEGFYATVGQSMLHGGVPYRDAFDNKPPMVFGWYALGFLLFGENVWAPRLLVSILLSVTTLLVYWEGRVLFSRGGALLASAGFALSLGITKFQTSANTEFFMLLPMVGALVSFTTGQQTRNLAWYLASGFLSGIAIMTKETSLLNFAFLIGFAAIPELRDRRWRMLVTGPVGSLCLGCGVALLAVTLPFLVVGAIGDFVDSVIGYTWNYVGYVPLYAKLINAPLQAPGVALVAGPWVLLSLLGIWFTIRDEPSRRNWLLVGWLGASVIGIIYVGRYYHHYYVQLLPGMSLLLPPGVRFLQLRWQRRSVRFAAYVVLTGTVALAVPLNGDAYVQVSYNARHEAKYREDVQAVWETESPDLAAYIRERTRDGDLIYNLGFQSELYFYSGRGSPTRFLFDRPFEVDESFADEVLHDLEANPPAYIIDSARYETWRSGRFDAPRLRTFIAEQYDYIGKIYYADVYRLDTTKRR